MDKKFSLETRQILVALADKYEIPSFCDGDPSRFLRWYPVSQIADVECCSFIAAMLAFGNRKQFIPKIQSIMEMADKTSGSVSKWLLAGSPNFPCGEKKFYRFYSYDDMHCFFGELAEILKTAGSLGEYFHKIWKTGVLGDMPLGEGVAEDAVVEQGETAVAEDRGRLSPHKNLDLLISNAFPESAIVPKGKNSANKRVHMFLRWMVRQNSMVDLGIWNWYPQSALLIPLDVHVMQEGKKLGLLPENATASRKTAVMLTEKMKEVFPEDPARADFSLFGTGVDR